MRRQLLCILVTVASLIALSSGQTPSSKKVLALYFTNLPASTTNVDAITAEFSSRIGGALQLTAADVRFHLLTAAMRDSAVVGSYLPFTIQSTTVVVTDSISTPETYTKYSGLWRDALTQNADVKKPFKFNEIELAVDVNQYEVTKQDDTKKVPEVGEEYLEGYDPTVMTSNQRQEMLEALTSRTKVMQFRLKNVNLEDHTKSWSQFNVLLDGTRSVAASILEVPANNVVLYSVKPGSIVVQFTIHPTPDVNQVNEKWNKAVKEKRPALISTFTGFDFDFPALMSVIPQPKPTATPAKSSSVGIIAGAVIGGLAGIAIIGGTAGYIYKRRQKKAGQRTVKRQNFGDVSPGGVGMTPSALSNVKVQGEVTPNPHNYGR